MGKKKLCTLKNYKYFAEVVLICLAAFSAKCPYELLLPVMFKKQLKGQAMLLAKVLATW